MVHDAMRRWHRLDRQAELRLVRDLARDVPGARSRLYDGYAAGLYDYAAALTGDGRGAADIVSDALVDACGRAARMRDRRRLRAWLYGNVRRACLRRLARGDRRPAADEADADPLTRALRDLTATELDALYLGCRHGLRGRDLTAVLGCTAWYARRRIARAAARLEALVGAAYPGGTPGDGGTTDPVAVPALPAADLVRLPPAREPPARLRERVLHTAADPALARYRAKISARGGLLRPSGLPRQPDEPSRRRLRLTVGAATLAGLAAVVFGLRAVGDTELPSLVVPGAGPYAAGAAPGHPARPTSTAAPAAAGGSTPVARTAPASRPARTGAVPSASASADPSAQPSGTASRPAPSPSGSGPPPASPRPSTPPTAPTSVPIPTVTARLVATPVSVDLGSSDNSATLRLKSTGGRLDWQASTSAPLTVSATRGSVESGRVVTVTVKLSRNALLQTAGSGTVVLRAAGRTVSVPVTWSLSIL